MTANVNGQKVSFVLREIAWDNGTKLYALAIEAPLDAKNLDDAQVIEVEKGYIFSFGEGRYQVGLVDTPLPRSIMNQKTGIDIFLVDEKGITIDALRVVIPVT